jgi:hypothetical protein
LVVFDAGNAKVLRFVVDGTVIEERPVDAGFIGALLGSGMMWAFLDEQEIVAQPAPRLLAGNNQAEFTIVRTHDLGAGMDTIARSFVDMFQPTRLTPIAVPGAALPVAAALGGGLMAVGGVTPQYTVQIVDREGQIQRQICWDRPPLPYSDAEVSGVEGANIPGLQEELKRTRPSADLAAIGRLIGDDQGNLWVQRDRPSPLSIWDRFLGRRAAEFDMFDSNGQYVGSVRAPDRVRVTTILEDLAIGIRTGEYDELSVVGLALPNRWGPDGMLGRSSRTSYYGT